MNLPRMAWRNLWRNPRRSVVTVAAMTLSIFFMIIYAGLVEGYTEAMERTITELEIGDLQIFAEGYRDKPSLYTRFDAQPVLAKLEQDRYAGSARLLGSGLGAAADTATGVRIIGIDPVAEAKVTTIHEHVLEGTWVDDSAPTEVVIGKRLAKILAVTVGDELVVLTQDARGGMSDALYTIRGILKAVSDATDRAGVFMTADSYRVLFAIEDGAHQIVVRRPDDIVIADSGVAVRAMAPTLDVQTWQELMPTIAEMMVTQKGAITVMFFIVYIAIAIILLNAMLMAVFERVQELGVLKAIGLGPAQVLGLLLFESGLMATVAICVAVSASVPALAYLSTHGLDLSGLTEFSVLGVAFDPVWRAAITPRVYSGPLGSFIAIVLMSGGYPAYKAATLSPAEAIRHR